MTQQTTTGRRATRVTAILGVTLELLGEVGYDQLTIDAVVVRAGASKATIYRRWADKRELVCAALLAASQGHPQLPAGATSLREDLLALVALMSGLGANESAHAFASLLAAAQQDPMIADVMRVTALEPRRQDCRDVVQRAIGRGELRDPALAATLFDLAIGQIIVRFLLQGDGFDETQQTDFVDRTLIPVLTHSSVKDGRRDNERARH